MDKSTKSNAGDGKPAEIPLSTEGKASTVSVSAEKMSMMLPLCSFNVIYLSVQCLHGRFGKIAPNGQGLLKVGHLKSLSLQLKLMIAILLMFYS